MEPKAQARPRIQFDVTERRMGEIDGLVQTTGLTSRTELIDEALALYEWAVTEIERGNKPASRSPTGEITQIITTGLARVRRTS